MASSPKALIPAAFLDAHVAVVELVKYLAGTVSSFRGRNKDKMPELKLPEGKVRLQEAIGKLDQLLATANNQLMPVRATLTTVPAGMKFVKAIHFATELGISILKWSELPTMSDLRIGLAWAQVELGKLNSSIVSNKSEIEFELAEAARRWNSDLAPSQSSMSPVCLTDNEYMVLRAIRESRPRLVLLEDLSAGIPLGRKACGKVVHSLISRSLAERPYQRKGVTITKAGEKLLALADAPRTRSQHVNAP